MHRAARELGWEEEVLVFDAPHCLRHSDGRVVELVAEGSINEDLPQKITDCFYEVTDKLGIAVNESRKEDLLRPSGLHHPLRLKIHRQQSRNQPGSSNAQKHAKHTHRNVPSARRVQTQQRHRRTHQRRAHQPVRHYKHPRKGQRRSQTVFMRSPTNSVSRSMSHIPFSVSSFHTRIIASRCQKRHDKLLQMLDRLTKRDITWRDIRGMTYVA
jgi:hypothetical protein